MRLYVMRHGIAEDTSPSGRDGDRRLTSEGRRKMREAGAGLRALGVRFDAILTSPLPRAAETAAIVASAFREGPRPVEVAALGTATSVTTAWRAIVAQATGDDVLVVGHEPTLSGLCAMLLTGTADGCAVSMKKGMCVAIDVPGFPARPRGALTWALTPKAMRMLAGHD